MEFYAQGAVWCHPLFRRSWQIYIGEWLLTMISRISINSGSGSGLLKDHWCLIRFLFFFVSTSRSHISELLFTLRNSTAFFYSPQICLSLHHNLLSATGSPHVGRAPVRQSPHHCITLRTVLFGVFAVVSSCLALHCRTPVIAHSRLQASRVCKDFLSYYWQYFVLPYGFVFSFSCRQQYGPVLVVSTYVHTVNYPRKLIPHEKQFLWSGVVTYRGWLGVGTGTGHTVLCYYST